MVLTAWRCQRAERRSCNVKDAPPTFLFMLARFKGRTLYRERDSGIRGPLHHEAASCGLPERQANELFSGDPLRLQIIGGIGVTAT